MEKVTISEVEAQTVGGGSDRRALSGPLGTAYMAINHYRLAPGEALPGGLHAHMDQEEVFVVQSGEATFETLDGEVTVGEGETIRFEPGEFQSGKNDADSELRVLALGAPCHSDDIRIPVDCPECSHDDLRLTPDDDSLTFVCPDCGAERTPKNCPECTHPDLRVVPGATTRTVVVCRGCGAEFDRPPVRE